MTVKCGLIYAIFLVTTPTHYLPSTVYSVRHQSDHTSKLVELAVKLSDDISGGCRIFQRRCANSQNCYYFQIFGENCMKMKEFGPRGHYLQKTTELVSLRTKQQK